MTITEHEITGKEGTWKVLIKGDALCIVDDRGRERYRGESYVITGIQLAMQLMPKPFLSTPEMDECLQDRARKFRED